MLLNVPSLFSPYSIYTMSIYTKIHFIWFEEEVLQYFCQSSGMVECKKKPDKMLFNYILVCPLYVNSQPCGVCEIYWI
jgi:hypothetical protein